MPGVSLIRTSPGIKNVLIAMLVECHWLASDSLLEKIGLTVQLVLAAYMPRNAMDVLNRLSVMSKELVALNSYRSKIAIGITTVSIVPDVKQRS
jgi:hypothetical protein